MSDRPPNSVGLAGDGDEINAITDVEQAFGVKLDYSDAPHWRTASDVFNSVKRALPSDEHIGADLWEKFATALSAETGVDPQSITPESPLLLSSHPWRDVQKVTITLWAIVLVCLVSAVAMALF